MDAPTLAARIEGLQLRLRDSDVCELNMTLETLKKAQEEAGLPKIKHFPTVALPITLKELASATTWKDLQSKTGLEKYEKVFRVATCALDTALKQQNSRSVPRLSFDPRLATDADWCRWCELVTQYGFADYKFGRFARSLRDIPIGHRTNTLSDFTSRFPEELRETRLGEFTQRSFQNVLEVDNAIFALFVIASVAQTLLGTESDSYLSVSLLPTELHKAQCWVTQRLALAAPPSVEEVQSELVNPLLRQLANDLDTEYSERVEWIRARWAAPPHTFKDLADHELAKRLDITRQAIEDWVSKALVLLPLRWHEGQHLLKSLCFMFPVMVSSL